MAKYIPPTLTPLGSVQERTLENIYKTAGKGDVLYVAGDPEGIPIPGGSVTGGS
jgi:hypothetical protein